MPRTKKAQDEERELIRTMRKLDRHMNEVAEYYQPVRYLWYNFLRGVVYGLGFLAAIALVVPVVIYALKSVHWVPLIGDFVLQIAMRIQEAQQLR